MALTILLAHFCDIHGPRSILSTQCTTLAPEQHVLPAFSKESYCTSCLLLLPKKSTLDTTLPTTTLQTEWEGEVYATTQYSGARFRVLNSVVRKCLSEETPVYDARPMYFGDASRGYSITQSFKLKDLEARGSERRYAFIVNSTEESEILDNWERIVEAVSLMIEFLIKGSKEHEVKSSSNNDIFLRGKNMQSRSMTELLGDDQLFLRIHLWNARLLLAIAHDN